jgi:hypothetical protein
MLTLRLMKESFEVPFMILCQTCSAFTAAPRASSYEVRAAVSSPIFRRFVDALSGHEIAITAESLAPLEALCEEFGFRALQARLAAFARGRDSAVDRLDAQMRTVSAQVSDLGARLGALERLCERLHADCAQATERVRGELSLLRECPPFIDSWIVGGLPALFDDFSAKRLALLWRGSSDGFSAAEFHARCDGCAGTLAIVRDVEGNVFGGFTPVAWTSRHWNKRSGTDDNCLVPDPTGSTFLFALRNPWGKVGKFPVKNQRGALWCSRDCGPSFGYALFIAGDCHEAAKSQIRPADPFYEIEGSVFRAGSPFQVEEIEVFHVTDWAAPE